ncbi:inositol monophosphatase family protein [Salinisphaera sp. Q1T1-3]|uniref:inositol monophosphatase family protein n=1 Tax=Salinisphaera sp. Q1T1-3 TaxID=2321229 RepID=UPI000E71E1DC|nr:inositol monophosphatase family protein [Salinisphaera sp. Q1T1-3]RJS92334.1 inositol monophosphatase [Salinisphaera sp. Q1T1-3]
MANVHPLTSIAVNAARRAGDVILSYYRRGETGQVSQKNENDFVTDADHQAERVIIDTIRRSYPDHAFIAEESGESGDPDTAEAVWIIDPIDGTSNFIRGIPHFCVSIACRIKGVIEHAVIYDPIKDELFTADRGVGTILDGRRVRVSTRPRLRDAVLATGFTYARYEDITTRLPLYNRLLCASGGMRCLGSAALGLAYVAAGRHDAYWEYGLGPWDMAAGVLMVRAAGGIASDAADNDANPLETGNILAANAKIYPQLLDKIAKTPKG